MNRPKIYLLSLLPALALASCSSEPAEPTGDESAPAAAIESSPSVSDASMNESSPSPELIALGNTTFNTGFCHKCHQQGGVGGERAPNLTDDEWVQCDGTVEGIKSVIISGVPVEKHSKPGYPFGMNSAAKMNLDDATVDALAAYIHSLSQ